MDQVLHRVRLVPEEESVEVPAGTGLRDALAQLGITVTAPCGTEGSCGKCRVSLPEGGAGTSPLSSNERTLLTSEQIEANERLSCQVKVQGNVTVSVPASSRASDMRILLGGLTREFTVAPAVCKAGVEMSPQTLEEAWRSEI
jgi:ferredoxin